MSDFSPYQAKIDASGTLAALDALELELFSRKHGVLTVAMKDLGVLPPEERVKKGATLNRSKQLLTEAIAERRRVLTGKSIDALGSTDKLDVTLELPPRDRGHLHLIPEFIRQVEEVFGRMGFEI